jgi:hypothetical protein
MLGVGKMSAMCHYRPRKSRGIMVHLGAERRLQQALEPLLGGLAWKCDTAAMAENAKSANARSTLSH